MASPCTCKFFSSKPFTPLLAFACEYNGPIFTVCSVWKRRYGVVLRKQDLLKEAVDVFVEAIHALPLHWGAWLELSNLVTNVEMVNTFLFLDADVISQKELIWFHLSWSLVVSPQLKSLSLPDCWVKDFFMAHMYTELQMIKEALQKYQSLIEAGFCKSTYIISQIAVAYHNIRGLLSSFSCR